MIDARLITAACFFSLALSAENESSFRTKIIGGRDCNEAEFPASVAIIFSNNSSRGTCSGTLIAPDVVLTAAHCIVPSSNARYFVTPVRTVYHHALQISSGTYAHSYSLHRTFDSTKLNDDIALLFLSSSFPMEPAQLIDSETLPFLKKGQTIEIVGWGKRHSQQPEHEPHQKSCATTTIETVTTNKIQIGKIGLPQKCFGDSGGSTYLKHPLTGERLLVGISSSGIPGDKDCQKGSVDTRVDIHVDWIKQSLKTACLNGMRNRGLCEREDL